MDADDFRSVVEREGADVWSFMEAAISVAATDHPEELRLRRDKIVEALYAAPPCPTSRRSGGHGEEPAAKAENSRRDANDSSSMRRGAGGALIPPRLDEDEEEDEVDEEEEGDGLDPYGGLFDDEQTTILKIKQQLDEPDQSEDALVDLLQSLADMEITFAALQETDIGRHVNGLRKHPSSDVRRLVKHLVRKWIDIVDDWVKTNPQGDHSASALMADGDSPQQKLPQNDHPQVPDFGCSPIPHYGSSGSEKNSGEPERKARIIPRKEAPSKPTQRPAYTSAPAHSSVQRQREQPKETNVDVDAKLASARKRLQANYKEVANAKKQRTIQVMDIHELPKPKAKNAFFAKNKSGGSQGRHW